MKLYNADCLDILPTFVDRGIDCVITDIPYGEVNRKSNGLRNLDKSIADIVTFDLEKLTNELCRIVSGSVYIYSVEQNRYLLFVR